jgi:hypothetical protein
MPAQIVKAVFCQAILFLAKEKLALYTYLLLKGFESSDVRKVVE